MTLVIIIVTAIVSVYAFQRRDLFHRLKFDPYLIHHQRKYYRMVTHAFVHADWMHLLFNMLSLYFFGPYVEAYFKEMWGLGGGIFLYLLLYLGGTICSSLYSLARHKNNYHYAAVGASGAVSAVIYSFILFQPMSKIALFIIPIGIPAFIFGILYLALSYYMARRNMDNIGHDAHFWGAVYGFFFPLFFEPSLIKSFFYQIGI